VSWCERGITHRNVLPCIRVTTAYSMHKHYGAYFTTLHYTTLDCDSSTYGRVPSRRTLYSTVADVLLYGVFTVNILSVCCRRE